MKEQKEISKEKLEEFFKELDGEFADNASNNKPTMRVLIDNLIGNIGAESSFVVPVLLNIDAKYSGAFLNMVLKEAANYCNKCESINIKDHNVVYCISMITFRVVTIDTTRLGNTEKERELRLKLLSAFTNKEDAEYISKLIRGEIDE